MVSVPKAATMRPAISSPTPLLRPVARYRRMPSLVAGSISSAMSKASWRPKRALLTQRPLTCNWTPTCGLTMWPTQVTGSRLTVRLGAPLTLASTGRALSGSRRSTV